MRARPERSLALFAVLVSPLLAFAQDIAPDPSSAKTDTIAAAPDPAALYPYRMVWLSGDLDPAQGAAVLPPADDYALPVKLPFAFQFFGYLYPTAYVSSNGFISFSAADAQYSNSLTYLQSKNGIAPLWDDWDTHCGRGAVLYADAGDRAVFTWAAVPHNPCYSSTATATFQAVLFQNGNIELHFGPISDGISATYGISTADVVSTIGWDVTGRPTGGDVLRFFPNHAPTVTLAPLPGLTNAAPLRIFATITDPDGDALTARVYLDGRLVVTAPVVDGAISALVPLAGDGPHTIRVEGSDAFGGVGSASGTTVYDGTAPALDVDPTPDLAGTSALTVTGSASDPNGVSVSVAVNGVAYAAALDGAAFSATVPLAPGANRIEVTARDGAGNATAAPARLVTLDGTPPAVSLTAPLQVVPSTPFAVTFSVTDETATSADVSVGAFTLTGAPVPNDGSAFTVVVDLVEGPATLVVIVTDSAGHSTTLTRDVLVDLSAPLVQLETAFDQRPVLDGMILGSASGGVLAFNFVVDDLSPTETTLVTAGELSRSAAAGGTGGAALLPAGGGVVSGSVPLVEGPNTVTFVTTDYVHEPTTLSRTVLYDGTPPDVTVLAPAPDAAVRGVLEWSATAEDARTGVASAAVRLDGGDWTTPVAAADGATWTAPFDTRALRDGGHVLESSFSDGAGNVRTTAVTFTVDNAAPSVALSPLPDWIRGIVTIEATATDATSGVASLRLSVDGVPRQTCTDPSMFPCTYALDTTAFLDGSITVAATATDGAGNEVDTQLFPRIDNSAPANFLVSPSEGSVVTGSLTVAVNVDDPGFAGVQCFVGGAALAPSTDRQFTETVSLLDRVDGPLTVACTVRDLAGNEGTQAVTVTVRGWTASFEPNTLNLRSRGTTVSMTIEGATVGLLVPVAASHVALSVPGAGAAIAALDHPASASTQDADGDGVPELQLKFDRGALVDAIGAGIALGAIDPSAAVRVTLLVNGEPSASDTIRIVR